MHRAYAYTVYPYDTHACSILALLRCYCMYGTWKNLRGPMIQKRHEYAFLTTVASLNRKRDRCFKLDQVQD